MSENDLLLRLIYKNILTRIFNKVNFLFGIL